MTLEVESLGASIYRDYVMNPSHGAWERGAAVYVIGFESRDEESEGVSCFYFYF